MDVAISLFIKRVSAVDESKEVNHLKFDDTIVLKCFPILDDYCVKGAHAVLGREFFLFSRKISCENLVISSENQRCSWVPLRHNFTLRMVFRICPCQEILFDKTLFCDLPPPLLPSVNSLFPNIFSPLKFKNFLSFSWSLGFTWFYF